VKPQQTARRITAARNVVSLGHQLLRAGTLWSQGLVGRVPDPKSESCSPERGRRRRARFCRLSGRSRLLTDAPGPVYLVRPPIFTVVSAPPPPAALLEPAPVDRATAGFDELPHRLQRASRTEVGWLPLVGTGNISLIVSRGTLWPRLVVCGLVGQSVTPMSKS